MLLILASVLVAAALSACRDAGGSGDGAPRVVATTTQAADLAREVGRLRGGGDDPRGAAGGAVVATGAEHQDGGQEKEGQLHGRESLLKLILVFVRYDSGHGPDRMAGART